MWLPLFLLIHRTHTFRTQEPASSVQRLLMRSLAASLIHEVLFCCVILPDSCGLLWFRCAPAFFLSDRHLVWNRFYIVFSRSLSNGIAQVCLDPYGSFAYPGFQVIQILSSCFRFLFWLLRWMRSFLIYSASLRVLWRSRLFTTLVSPFLCIWSFFIK